MSIDARRNFALSSVAVAPTPAASGLALDLVIGGGALMPTPPFNAVCWPEGAMPLASNAEIMRVGSITGDSVALSARGQEGTSAQQIAVGWQFADMLTAKTIEDLKNMVEAETARAEAAESANTTAISAETTRAESAEGTLTTAVASAITTAETVAEATAKTTSEAEVKVEKERAEAAEALRLTTTEKGAANGVASLTAGSIGAQPPAHHASTHAEGGSDPLTTADLPASVVTSSTVNHGEAEGEQTPNLAEGRVHTYLAKGAFALEKPSNWPAGTTYVSVEVVQNSAGAHKITTPGLTWIGGPEPKWNEAANAVNVIQLVSFDGGVHWFGEAAPQGAEGPTGPEGSSSTDTYLGLIRPVYLSSSILPSEEAINATALKAYFNRIVIPKTGVLHDVTISNGSVVNGNHNVALFDTGQATAGKYTKLWESGSVAAAGEKKWQSRRRPRSSAVVKGEQLLLAVMNSGTTHKFGIAKAAISGAVAELPASFIPTTGGAKPKVLGQHLFTELAFATITEANLEPGGIAVLTIARVA